MYPFKQYIESNRQAGTTTALIKIAKEVHGDIVVGNQDTKRIIVRNHPELEDHVYTVVEITNGNWRGRKQAPVFFDTDAIWWLLNKQEEALKKPIVIKDSTFVNDGYNTTLTIDSEGSLTINTGDGYNKHEKQLNVKLTKVDEQDIKEINDEFFEGEASKSMMGRVLLRKGIHFYKKLSNSMNKHGL